MTRLTMSRRQAVMKADATRDKRVGKAAGKGVVLDGLSVTTGCVRDDGLAPRPCG